MSSPPRDICLEDKAGSACTDSSRLLDAHRSTLEPVAPTQECALLPENLNSEISGVFKQYDMSGATDADDVARKFFACVHNNKRGKKRGLAQALREARAACPKSLVLRRSPEFERLLSIMRYFIRARWRAFLLRNSGVALRSSHLEARHSR